MNRYLSALVALGIAAVLCLCSPGFSAEPNRLSLDVPGSLYVKPGDNILVQMDVSNLQQPVSSCQVFLSFPTACFLSAPGDVGVAPGGGVWSELIWSQMNTLGDLDVAVGVRLDGPLATTEDGTVAKVTLKTRTDVEATTRVVFRPDASPDPALVGSTILGSMLGEAVWPFKVDSPVITIDGTRPSVLVSSVKQFGSELIGQSGSVISGSVSIQVQASDPIHSGVQSGLSASPNVNVVRSDGSVESVSYVNESPAGTFNYTWEVLPGTPSGAATVTAVAADRSGNVSTNSTTLNVNTNTITGTISMDTLRNTSYSFDRVVVFKATDAYGVILKTWLVSVHFVNGPVAGVASGGYSLADVPPVTGALSAKTDWSLRRRKDVTLAGGTATVSFDGASRLLGGDLTTDNIVNVSDYNCLRANWLLPVAAADINGDGLVNVADYNIVKTYWFVLGDPM